jgi:hypothetical protein
MDLNYLDKININFIIGAGRSGTTLLALIINHHPNCISTPELKHFLYFYKKYKNMTEVTQNLLDDLREYFTVVGANKKNVLFNIEDNFYLKNLTIGLKMSYAQLTKYIYVGFFSSVKNMNEITCIVDKNPFYTFHTDKILDVFPDSKFVCIMRDYRAFVLSNRQSQKPFIMVKSVAYYAYAWKEHARKIIQLKQTHPEKLLVVNYEKLVLNKETEIGRIFDFIRVAYSPSVFDFHKTLAEKTAALKPEGKVTERAIKKIMDLSKPINSDRVDSWKKSLTTFQQKNAEYICDEEGTFFGYLANNVPSLMEKLTICLISIPGRIRVTLFYLLNSVRIHHYLNEVRKARFEKKLN